ncbi:MAG: hypothetical protein KAI77_00655 [Gammaproteobacteria bacterium]|nr:hypothetical protein [Gammaproteobacteria bacterium]
MKIPQINLFLRFGKVFFASYAVAIGVFILSIIIGSFLIGFEDVDKHVIGNAAIILVIVTLISLPFVNKKLK